ncbi:hypothetical protein [Pseudomonas panipatensis]|uniref:hypothetical protein n=1 Tax=Pseudomonas panipatensis TaxID=428992 RepID=UPI0035B4537B
MMTRLKKAKLADALLDDYPEVVTGYIVDAQVISGCLVGAAYKAWGYATGERLVSGRITTIIQFGKRWMIKTCENDCLVVVNFSRGGRRSLLHLVDLFQSAEMAHSRFQVH